MMLTPQPSTTPVLVPGDNGALPIWWIERGLSNEAAVRSTMLSNWLLIPQQIRDTFTQRWINTDTLELQQFKYVAGTESVLHLGIIPATGSPVAGLYKRNSIERTMHFSAYVNTGPGAEYTNGGHSTVHEFGHHIDFTYDRLWRGNVRSTDNRALSLFAPFTTIFATVNPSIPTNVYGKDAIAEWFAELWRCQITQDDLGMYYLLGLNNYSTAIWKAARKAFTDLLPMPNYPPSFTTP